MILVEEKWKDVVSRLTSRDTRGFLLEIESFRQMENFRVGVSWHIPTSEIIKTLKSISPVVSVGSGFAYTESLALKEGIDIIPTDIKPNKDNHWCREGNFFCKVEKLNGIGAVKKYSDRNVFMAWPPYDKPMAADVAENMQSGRYLLYIGEDRGGCTGDDNFFDILENRFEMLKDFSIPRWSGIYDRAKLYKKI